MNKLLNKTPDEAAADIAATNNLAKSLLEAFRSLALGFLPGTTITKKKPLELEVDVKQRNFQPQPERLGTPSKPAAVGTKQNYEGNWDRIYGLGINKLTSADLQAIAAIVNGKQGTKIGGNDDYIIRHNGKIIFETTLGEVTTHTRLSNELRDRIVGLKASVLPSTTSAPIPSKPTKSDRVPHNLAAEIKDFATAGESFVSSEEARNHMKTYHQLTQGIVPELTPAIPHGGRYADDNQPEQIEAITAQTATTSLTAEVTQAEKLAPTLDPDLKIVRFLFNLFGRNTNKENHNTTNGREGILELPTGAKLINKIDRGTAYLTLMRDGNVYELGSYNHATKEHTVGLGLVDIKTELAELKPYIDPKTLTISEHNSSLAHPTSEQNHPSPKPSIEDLPVAIGKAVVKQNHPQLESAIFMNVEAEENLLAKILMDGDALAKAIERGISDRSFDAVQYQQIFNSARSIADRGAEVNLLSVGDAMQDKHPDINSSLIAILSRDNPTVSLDSATSIVRNNQIGREILRVGRELKVAAEDRHQPIFQIVHENLGSIADIQNGSYQPAPPTPTALPPIADLSNLRSEEQIITALLQVPQATDYLTKSGLTSNCFTHPEHQAIYAAAQDLDRNRAEINLLSVRNRLDRNAATRASNIVESTPVLPVNIHVGRVIELRQRRELLNVADMLGRVVPQPSGEELLNVLVAAKTAIEQTASTSLKLPELKIEQSQPAPEKSPRQHPSRGM